MPRLYYLGKAWQDNPEPDDYEDDLEELPTHCMECGGELAEGDELLCTVCTDELRSVPAPPERGEDGWIDQYYEDTVSDPPF